MTNKTAEISYSLAYRSLDVYARCVLVAALPEFAENNIGEKSTGISRAIKVSASEFAAMWKLNEPAQAFVRPIRGCDVRKKPTVRFRWYPEHSVRCIHDSSWLNGSYCLEIPAGTGLNFVPPTTGSVTRLLQDIHTDEELAFV